MPNLDVIYNSDMAMYQNGASCCNNSGSGSGSTNGSTNSNGCNCSDNNYYWGPPSCYPPPMPYSYPPPPPMPPKQSCECQNGEISVSKKSIEGQICKFSKQAAVINRMIENLEKKKKDVIIKVGDTSYNFGNVDLEVKTWKAVEETGKEGYADTVLEMCKTELNLIKEKISGLAEQLDEELDAAATSLFSTVATEDSEKE